MGRLSLSASALKLCHGLSSHGTVLRKAVYALETLDCRLGYGAVIACHIGGAEITQRGELLLYSLYSAVFISNSQSEGYSRITVKGCPCEGPR